MRQSSSRRFFPGSFSPFCVSDSERFAARPGWRAARFLFPHPYQFFPALAGGAGHVLSLSWVRDSAILAEGFNDKNEGVLASIVILEDDSDFADLLQVSLTSEGHIVEVFDTASDAIEHIKVYDADLVIVDMFIHVDGKIIPDGGIKLTSQLKQTLNHPAPVIAISGSFSGGGGLHAKTSAATVGAKAVLAKPFQPSELIALVNKFLN